MYKIVFAEDEAPIRDYINRVVEWEKYEFQLVAMAADGEQALAAIREYQPQVLITDIRMPFMDGLELSRRAKEILPSIKIIILSGFMEFCYAQEAISVGVQDYIIKPITPLKLIRLLTKLHEQFEEEGRRRKHYDQLVSELRSAEQLLQERMETKLFPEDLVDITKKERLVNAFIQMGSCENAYDLCEQLFDKDERDVAFNTTYSRYLVLRILSVCIQYMEEIGKDANLLPQEMSDISTYLENIRDIGRTKNMICAYIEAVIRARKRAINATAETINRAKQYVANHYSSVDLSAKQVANAVGLTPNYFSNAFKQTEGISFVKYLTSYRIERAKELLRSGNNSIVEVAEMVGYENANYFSTVFRRIVGITPNRFRNQ